MSKIEYEEVERTRASDVMRVVLDNKTIGTIRVVEGGFAYFPKGLKRSGEVFKTVREVQASLENDDNDS